MIRSYLAVLGLAAMAAPAVAACPNDPPTHTRNAVIVDGAGAVRMVVIPTDDCELDEATFNPAGLSQIRVAVGGSPIVEAARASSLMSTSLSASASVSLSTALSGSASVAAGVSSSLAQ